MDRRGGTHNRAETGMWLSLAVYAAMALGKLAVGFAAHSTALQADGWNNATDLLALAAVLVGLKYARKPPDADHLRPLAGGNDCRFCRRPPHDRGGP
ncbi:cation transporter [Calditerricola satsumensis]|uniref:cation transporter n=1 Tax=Calditerricola satsumensis TaxID=373054 RepID=UPI0006D1C7D4|nr:cation transporter [Calditerricola satsumensis]